MRPTGTCYVAILLPMLASAPFEWHVHEFAYGSAPAIVARFLLDGSKLDGRPVSRTSPSLIIVA
jgi:uncharacterized protein involved in response to NO